MAFTSHGANIPSLSNQRLLGCSLNVQSVHVFLYVIPQADRVLIRLEELPEKSFGGVLVLKSAVKFERYLMGEDVETGKKVLFSDINAYEVDLGTEARHCFCKTSDLLSVVGK
ncbi:hypothetical protein F0562_018585 [Nyssa sinensis]|uniref:Uncharacterized protein n=1 Tax=Nyssa sinensis TaxID=561372 RepID=A0A5J4ZDE4_9ASTE|nr:hypothetical protein F0562_018585 [Nyssa sinensis]